MIRQQSGSKERLQNEGNQPEYLKNIKSVNQQAAYRDVLQAGQSLLQQAGIEEYEIDAWYLFSECFQMDRSEFFLKQTKPAPAEQLRQYETLLAKRKERIPLQQILGKQEFMGFSFVVDENVLIPRQDTERLVEAVMKEAAGKRVLDMCTGSGCIILSLAKLLSLEKAVGVDISEKALAVAERNKETLQAEVTFLQSNLFDEVMESFDIIVSNPPYIESKQLLTLQPEVREHEPLLALDGGEDGLFYYRRIVREAPAYLRTGGKLFLEIGYNQGQTVPALLESAGFGDIQVIKDLAGLDRVVVASLQ